LPFVQILNVGLDLYGPVLRVRIYYEAGGQRECLQKKTAPN
jgi:hypothetical protein